MGRPRKPLRSSGLRGFKSHSFRQRGVCGTHGRPDPERPPGHGRSRRLTAEFERLRRARQQGPRMPRLRSPRTTGRHRDDTRPALHRRQLGRFGIDRDSRRDRLDDRRGDRLRAPGDGHRRRRGGHRRTASVRRLVEHAGRGAIEIPDTNRRRHRRASRRVGHDDLPRDGHDQEAVKADSGRPSDQQLQAGCARRRAVPSSRSSADRRPSSASRSGWSDASRRGTSHCIRSPPRLPTPWPPGVRWCSSRARSRRSTPSYLLRSSTRWRFRLGSSTSCPARVRSSVKQLPRTRVSTWCRSPVPPAPGDVSPSLLPRR